MGAFSEDDNGCSYLPPKNRAINKVYLQHENDKRRDYEQRVLQVEKCSFVPLVYSTTGGMGPRATSFHKRVATLVSEKRQETYAEVMSVMRAKLSFAMLRSVLISVRGVRGKYSRIPVTPLSCISFNMIPEGLGSDSFIPSNLSDL